MNDLPSIPWGKVFSNFTWILGAAIILAAFSYHEFLAAQRKVSRIDVFKGKSFAKPFLLGLILIGLGISASVHHLWLTIITGITTVLLIIWLYKIIKNQAFRSHDKD